MDLTDKWLGDIAGWQVLKSARSLLERGLVTEVRREGDSLRGLVTEGPKRFQSGLLIRTRTDVTNLCTCPASRSSGIMCAHSVAVALGTLRAAATPPPVRQAQPSKHESETHSLNAVIPAPLPPPGRFTFFLPDNLLDATFKGQAAVFMRFEPGRGEASDGGIAAWLRTQGLKPGTMPLMLTRGDLAKLLVALGTHHGVFSGKPSQAAPAEEQRLAVIDAPTRLPVLATEDGDDVIFSLDSTSVKRVANEWCFCSATRTFFAVASPNDDTRQLIKGIFEDKSASRPLSWLVKNRAALDEAMQLRLAGTHLSLLHLVPLPCEFELQLDGSMQAVEAELFVTFNQRRWLAMDGTPDEVNGVRFPLEATAHIGRFYSRNMERERGATERLFDLGFQPVSSTMWRLQGTDKVARFYASDLPRLQRIFKIDESQRWRTATRSVMRVTPKVLEPQGEEPKQGHDWLSLDIAYEASDGFRISRSEVMQLIRTGRRGMTGKDGRQYLLDSDACEEFEESLRDLDSVMTPDGVRVRADKAQFLFAADDETFAARQAASWQSEAWIKEQLPDLAVLLRPYQLDGIRWLEASARGAKAGLLADDMGLGKTIQAIALVRLLRAEDAETEKRGATELPNLSASPPLPVFLISRPHRLPKVSHRKLGARVRALWSHAQGARDSRRGSS